jgi:hypothetical protein
VSLPTSFLSYRGFRHMKLAAALLVLATLLFALHRPVGGRNGGTAVGYALGGLCALLMLWLLWFGVRKRSYRAAGAPLQGWLSAHVWWGATLLFLVPLHSAFQFGWNVHTLAYVAIVAVIASGLVGVMAYVFLPDTITQIRSGRRFDALLQEVADVDAECRSLAAGMPDPIARAVANAIESVRLGGGVRRQLRAEPGDASGEALQELERLRETLPAGAGTEADQLVRLLTRKQVLLQTLRSDIRQRTLLDLWLWVHVPLSIAAVAAVAVHVFVVFYYW